MNESPLVRHLRQLIAATGPISVAQYMAEALSHPEFGYYTTRDPFGAGGDFTTAPEISQMFGELIGAWCADIWQQMGAPDPVRLVELGPGRGTLMADALRATDRVAGFRGAIDLHLIETSTHLRDVQATTITDPSPTWHDTLDDVPAGPTLIVANELFDALPVHQFVYQDAAWHERLVTSQEGGGLGFVLGPEVGAPSVEVVPSDGAVHETCPAAEALMQRIASRIAAHGGAALIVDYGYDGPALGDTLQAVRNHESHDVLHDPGEADLCAHVDFPALRAAARGAGATVHGPVGQGPFLLSIGLAQRAAALAAAAPDQAAEIDATVVRLTAPTEMGSLFKVLAVTSAGIEPAGFDA